jgi:hypothetical protein
MQSCNGLFRSGGGLLIGPKRPHENHFRPEAPGPYISNYWHFSVQFSADMYNLAHIVQSSTIHSLYTIQYNAV